MQKKNLKYAIKRSHTGLGMFAQQDIPRNTRIVEYTGTRITNEEASKTGGRYIMYLSGTHALNGKQRTNAARYINHSCRPNAAAYTTGKRVWIWSKKAIKPGEEITLDYGPAYLAEYIQPGNCQCQPCRKKKARKNEQQ